MNTKVRFWLLAAGLVLLVVFATRMSVSRPPGVLVSEEPSQGPAPTLTYEKSGFIIHTLAYYSGRARVLSKEAYWIDNGATLAPYDLALGWGSMSDTAVLGRLSISQGSRFYSYRPTGREWPIPAEDIMRHSANTHIIPATDEVAKTLRWVRAGQVVRFSGYLVEAVHPSGSKWRSSLTRDDTGAGACELLWTERLEITD